MALANQQNCAVLNMSLLSESRLTFPRGLMKDLQQLESHEAILSHQNQLIDAHQVSRAQTAEKELGYLVPSGRYWESIEDFDPEQLRIIDDIWIDSAQY
jgi:hypothetical protein